MIYRCSSCQHETPEGVPPAPRTPERCVKCGAPVVEIHDTEPPPEPVPEELPEEDTPIADAAGKRPKLMISTMVYALAKELGPEGAAAELQRQVDELTGPFSRAINHDDYLPVAFTIARAMRYFDVGLFVDYGGTYIGRTRCRAMAHFLELGEEFDTWLSCDDDVECTVETLVALHEAVSDGAPSIALAPYFLREQPRHSVAFPKVVVDRALVGCGGKMRSCLYGGFGLVAMSREAARRVAATAPKFIDDDGKKKAMVFHDQLVKVEGDDAVRWFGEDFSFFSRVPPSVRVEALITGHTRHCGATLALNTLDNYQGLEVVPEFEEAQRLNGALRDVTQRIIRGADAAAESETQSPA